jgi:membrane-associated phospholipid phosphatase
MTGHAGGGHFGGRIGAFDARADLALERVRRWPLATTVFQAASTVGDFSLIWLVIGAVYGLGIQRDAGEALAFAGLIAIESLVVNQGIKRVFNRRRPTITGDPRMPVRKPRTSSFPSGHASSAAYAATLLTVWAAPVWAPLWFAVALVVALSRAVVRIHYASDVIAGLIVGLVLAQVVLAVGGADLLRH